MRIKRKSPSELLKTLGVYTSPSGQNNDQFEAMSDFSIQLSNRIKVASLTQLEASLLILVYIYSKLGYIFVASTFSKKQCNVLDTIYRKINLSEMSIHSKTNLDIVHASHLYNRLRISTSWDLQGSLHIHLLVNHLQLHDLVAQHLPHILYYSYLHIGLKKPPFSYEYKRIHQLIPALYISSSLEYISTINRKITCRKTL